MLLIEHALAYFPELGPPLDAPFDPRKLTLQRHGHSVSLTQRRGFPPLQGTVYGTLLNFRGALDALGDAVHQPPYKQPPVAPVLYIKPRNTLSGHNAPIALQADVEQIEIGASLGIVIGRTASRLREADALSHVAGYTIVNDVSVPHPNYYRPSIRYKCRDGFCPIGPWVVAAHHVANPNTLGIRVRVDGELVQSNTTANLIRRIERLLADVTDFMTLAPGDVLMVGVPEAAPRVRRGQRVSIEIDGIGRLDNPVIDADQLVTRVSS